LHRHTVNAPGFFFKMQDNDQYLAVQSDDPVPNSDFDPRQLWKGLGYAP
jgi:hypothetical protein